MEEPGEEATATVALQVLCKFCFDHYDANDDHDHDSDDLQVLCKFCFDHHDVYDDHDHDSDDYHDVAADPDNDSFFDPDPGLLPDPPEISVAKDMLQFHPKV